MDRTTKTTQTPACASARAGRGLGLLLAAAGLSACVSTGPKAPESTGAAGGATAVGADAQLATCAAPVGTVRLQDGNNAAASGGGGPGVTGGGNPMAILAMLREMQSLGGGAQAPGGSSGSVSLDSLRLLIQQSNCFMIVDRGLAAEAAADDEKRRTRTSGEVRDDANMGQGQEIAADYVLRSSVIDMGTKDSSSIGLGGLGFISKIAGSASVGRSVTEAKVQLVLSDIRSKLQISVAQGKASSSNIGLASNLLGKVGKGALGGLNVKSESKTSGSEILLQAFADAYNRMVPAIQNYKAQQVRGGAGTGGTLSVQGSREDPSAVKK